MTAQAILGWPDRMKERAEPMKDHDLTLVGLTEDQQRLVLVSDAGEEFTLPADARLRAALRGEHARLGQLEITMDSALRPRDIQARIRAGETPEQVAAAAQTSLEKVMTYASPVLAERAHVADRAQRASVRRKAGEGPARVLSEAVAERLRGRNLDPGSVEWDAWRREDGRWTLVADYRSGERARHAEFVFDAPGRYVVAEDDEARWLVGEPTASKGPQPRATPGPRRLSSVGDHDELPLGEDAIEMVAEDPPVTAAPVLQDQDLDADDVAPEDVPEDAAPEDAVREDAPGGGAAGAPDASAPEEVRAGTPDADWMATQASERPARHQPAPDPLEHPVELGSEADGPVGPDEVPSQPATDGQLVTDEPAAAEPLAEAAAEPPADEPGTPRKSAKKNRRPSVPSWDEIMFGGGKQD